MRLDALLRDLLFIAPRWEATWLPQSPTAASNRLCDHPSSFQEAPCAARTRPEHELCSPPTAPGRASAPHHLKGIHHVGARGGWSTFFQTRTAKAERIVKHGSPAPRWCVHVTAQPEVRKSQLWWAQCSMYLASGLQTRVHLKERGSFLVTVVMMMTCMGTHSIAVGREEGRGEGEGEGGEKEGTEARRTEKRSVWCA